MPQLVAPASIDFGQIIQVIESLPDLLGGARTADGLTVKTQAPLVGVTSTTLTRLAAGSNPTQATILHCLRYLEGR